MDKKTIGQIYSTSIVIHMKITSQNGLEVAKAGQIADRYNGQ